MRKQRLIVGMIARIKVGALPTDVVTGRVSRISREDVFEMIFTLRIDGVRSSAGARLPEVPERIPVIHFRDALALVERGEAERDAGQCPQEMRNGQRSAKAFEKVRHGN